MRVGVLLAAGASRRMGTAKPLVKVRGRSFLAHGLRSLWSACDTVVVVLGANAARVHAAVGDEVEHLVRQGKLHDPAESARRRGSKGFEARFVVNRDWRRGMLSSVRAGLRSALALGPEVVLVMPVDHPDVRSETVGALGKAVEEALAAFGGGHRRGPFPYAIVPRYRRRRGHPIALSPALARAVVADSAASDLSDAVRRNARLVGYLDCADSGIVHNRNEPPKR